MTDCAWKQRKRGTCASLSVVGMGRVRAWERMQAVIRASENHIGRITLWLAEVE